MGPLHLAGRPRCSAYFLGLIFAAGLLHGLLYVFLVPPWQHYDEPGHFEFAWLIANQGRLPQADDFDPEMRRQVAASMFEHNFFKDMDSRSTLISQTEPAWIGVQQINSSFLYYALVALPLRLLRYTDVTFQLYVARFLSLLLYLITLVAAYRLAAALTQPGHPLRFLVPATLVLLPGFVDMMTAVSDDVGATAAFSLLLWAGVSIIQRGFTWRRAVLLFLFAAACAFTKVTTIVALPLSVLALLFSILRGRRQALAWAVLFGGVLVVLLAFIGWGDAAHWARQTAQAGQTRAAVETAPHGRFAFQVVNLPGKEMPRIIQPIPNSQVAALRGKRVTFGFWMWASQTVKAQSPTLYIDEREVSYPVTLSQQPTYYAFTVNVSKKANTLFISLDPLLPEGIEPVTVYYDSLVLAEGVYARSAPPQLSDASVRQGMWGGKAFTNLLANPSAEQAGPYIRPLPWPGQANRTGHVSLSLVLFSLLDWPAASWYYQLAAKNLFETFWARPGWGHVPLIAGRLIYRFLAAGSLLGVLSAVAALTRRRKLNSYPWASLAILGLALLGVWIPTILRGITSLVGVIFMPAARYAFPAIIPTILVLCAGWLEILHSVSVRIRFPLRVFYVLYSLALFGLGVLALASLVRFYG